MTTLPANVTHPCYHDEDAAREMFEAFCWPQGPFCPTCGAFDTVAPLGGESIGAGWYWCTPCRLKFTVRVGSVLERSHIPLHKWLIALRLYGPSYEGFLGPPAPQEARNRLSLGLVHGAPRPRDDA
jgi:hypothetical protein